MIYRIIIFILLNVGVFALIRSVPTQKLTIKRQSVAQKSKAAITDKRHRLVKKNKISLRGLKQHQRKC